MDVSAGLVDRLGLDMAAGLKDVAATVVAVAAMPYMAEVVVAAALQVGGGHGAADQLDQVEVQRRDEEVDCGLEPHCPA